MISRIQRPARATVTVDLGAIAANVTRLRATVAPAEVWAVVKADGYGHGASVVGGAALAAGAARLCVATWEEARAIREKPPNEKAFEGDVTDRGIILNGKEIKDVSVQHEKRISPVIPAAGEIKPPARQRKAGLGAGGGDGGRRWGGRCGNGFSLPLFAHCSLVIGH